MFVCMYSARRCQVLAAMAYIRRFCTSSASVSETAYYQFMKKNPRGTACLWHLGSTTRNPLYSTVLQSNGRQRCIQYMGFSKLRLSTVCCGSSGRTCRSRCKDSVCGRFTKWCSTTGRSQSLHWDRRERSLMCLKNSTLHEQSSHCEEAPSPSKDVHKQQELPALFLIERSTVNHVLSMLTSTLPVQDGFKDITATLLRLSVTMHMQSIVEAAAKPWDEKCSDDIIIRNSQPVKPHTSHSCDDVTGNQPVGHPQYHQQGFKLFSESTNRIKIFNPLQAIEGNFGRHLYFNKVYHVPMIASIPETSHLRSSSEDQDPITTRTDGSSLAEQERGVSPQENNNNRPCKEQIMAMYERMSYELPNFFEKSHDFSMYASTVEFDNRIMNLKTKGLPAYKASIQSLKYLSSFYLTGSTMEVLRITAELDEGIIQARWRIKGVPLYSYMLRPWRRKHKDGYFDAFSTFEIGLDGLIHRHKVDKVMPTPSDKVRVPSLTQRIGIALGVVRNPALAPDCIVPKPNVAKL